MLPCWRAAGGCCRTSWLARSGTWRLLPIPRPVALKGASIELVEELLPSLRIGRVFAPTQRARLRIYARLPKRSSARLNPRCRAGSCFQRMPKVPTHRLVPLRKAAGFLRLEKNCFNYDDARPYRVRCVEPVDRNLGMLRTAFRTGDGAAELIDGMAELQPVLGLPLDAA